MPGPSITSVLERDVFASGDPIRSAASAAGHRVIDWSDEWWSDSVRPPLTGAILFHGSLGNADRIPRELPWKPGAYCQTAGFYCSAWYPAAAEWLLHDRWEIHPATRFIADSDVILDRLGVADSVFVRPDSPLKPFAGRVVRRGQIGLATLDYGFYYDDAEIPVVIAPLRRVLREWALRRRWSTGGRGQRIHRRGPSGNAGRSSRSGVAIRGPGGGADYSDPILSTFSTCAKLIPACGCSN